MSKYFETVKDIREALGDLPDDFPVSFNVDAQDCRSREAAGFPILVNSEVTKLAPDEVNPGEPTKILMFFVG